MNLEDTDDLDTNDQEPQLDHGTLPIDNDPVDMPTQTL